MTTRVPRRTWLVLLLAPLILPAAASAQGGATNGTWSQLDPGLAAPVAHRSDIAVFDQQRDRYLIYSGEGDGAPNPISLESAVWVLDLGASPAWTEITPPVGPGARHSPQAGYDPARQRLIIFGGYGYHYPGDSYPDYLSDVWELDLLGEPHWVELNPTGTPPSGRLAGASVYDPIRQRLVVFGGTVGATMDVYQLDLSGQGRPAWSVLPAAGTPPIAGYGMTTIYDPVRDRMLMFGGSTSDDYFGVHNDTWALTLGDAPAWTKLAPTGTPPTPRRSGTSLYDPVQDRMIVFGGWDNLSNATTSFLNDVYALSLAGDPAWSTLGPAGDPPAGRDAMAAAYDAPQNRLVVFGGWSGVAMLADTWFLDWGAGGTPAAIAPSAQAQVGLAQVQWNVTGATGTTVGVFRRDATHDWSSIATPQLDAQGRLAFDDPTVGAGQSYDYLVAVASHTGVQFDGQVSVDVPTVVGVIGGPTGGFALQAPHPNPSATGRFDVAFTLARAGAARLDLYDVGGRRVSSLEVGGLGAGDHRATFGEGSRLAPGLYFVRLTAPGVSLERRAVVVSD